MTYTQITANLIFCEEEKCLYDKSFSPPRMIYDCFFLDLLELDVDNERDKMLRNEVVRRIGWAYRKGRREAEQEMLQRIAKSITGKKWDMDTYETE